MDPYWYVMKPTTIPSHTPPHPQGSFIGRVVLGSKRGALSFFHLEEDPFLLVLSEDTTWKLGEARDFNGNLRQGIQECSRKLTGIQGKLPTTTAQCPGLPQQSLIVSKNA